MLDNFRQQYLVLDIANRRIYDKLFANSGDINGRKLIVKILDEVQEVDLTGTTVSLAWANGAVQGLDAFTAIDATKGLYELYYTDAMLTNIGNVTASLVLVMSDGTIESQAFNIVVKKGVINESVTGESSFTTLAQALVRVENLKSEVNEFKVTKGQEFDSLMTTKGQKFDSLMTTKGQEFDSLMTTKGQSFNAMQSAKEDSFDVWFEEVQSYFNEEAIGQLTNQINKVSSNLSTHANKKATASALGHIKGELTSGGNLKAKSVALEDKANNFAATNVEGAMSELFTNVSNGKSLVGGAITDVDDSVVIPTDPTFTDLAGAIGNISTGKKWASGSGFPSSGTHFQVVSGLPFRPSHIILRAKSKGLHQFFYSNLAPADQNEATTPPIAISQALPCTWSIRNDGFYLYSTQDVFNTPYEYNWIAFE